MAAIDWLIIIGYVALVTAVGFLFVKKASGSVADFFVAGRNLPWWIAGTSLIATSFAADTPLAITGIVAEHGIAGNWLWWNQMVVWILAIVFFARLWRRSGLVTDAEFIELRYGGTAGAFLRGFKAFYSSVIVSTYTLAWVMLGMQKIVSVTTEAPATVLHWQAGIEQALGQPPGSIQLWKWLILIVLFLVTTIYTVVSGVWGIMITDLIQMTVAFGGAAMLAVFAVQSVGGMDNLLATLATQRGAESTSEMLSFFPSGHSAWMPWSTFAIYLGVLWWGDCGGFVAQKMFATRSDRDSVLAAVWYSVIHFAFRPWLWIAVALAAMVTYPDLADKELAYPKMMMDVLPAGLRGLMFSALLAAFMSTVDTQLNWSASYYVNDIYRRFLRPNATEKQCVFQSRLATVGFAALAIVCAYYMTSVKNAWVYLFNLQAGIGLVLMLRWFWWRVNVWSEISSMVTSLVITPVIYAVRERWQLAWTDAFCILVTALVCTVVWLSVTLLTPPSSDERLRAFYRRVRPNGHWGPIARGCPETHPQPIGVAAIGAWLSGVVAVAAALFTFGNLMLGRWPAATAAIAVSAPCAFVAVRMARRMEAARPASSAA